MPPEVHWTVVLRSPRTVTSWPSPGSPFGRTAQILMDATPFGRCLVDDSVSDAEILVGEPGRLGSAHK